MPPKQPEISEKEQMMERIKNLENRVRLLERMTTPTKVKKGVLTWLGETATECKPFATVIRECTMRADLLLTLKKQGLTSAIMALWTRVFVKGAADCPLRSYSLSPSTLYGFDGEWKKMDQVSFGVLMRASEQWFIRAIMAECAEGSEVGSALFAKVIDSSADTPRLRSRLCTFLRQTLKEVRMYEFEP